MRTCGHDFWHMTSAAKRVELVAMRAIARQLIRDFADLRSTVGPVSSEVARTKQLAVRGGHWAMVALIVLALMGTIVKGLKVFSGAEVLELVLAGLVFLGLSLWGSLTATRAALEASAPGAGARVVGAAL